MITMEPMQREALWNIRDVKDYLGVSMGVVFAMVRDGRLRAFKVTGNPVRRADVNEDVWGLRFDPEEIRRFLESREVR